MTCARQDITIRKGSTFSKVLRWESAPLIAKAITGITKAAGAVITAVSHGMVDGWRCAVVSAGGMTEINAENYPPKASEFHKGTVLTANTIELNEVNSTDYTTWTSGGYLVYYTPVNLSGYTARMHIRESVESEDEVLALTSSDGISIDNTAKTITITIAATTTDDLSITSGVYDLELVSGSGVVTALLSGNVYVESEVTR